VFDGDDDGAAKIDLLSEVCGSAALGYATKLIQPHPLSAG
jgi:putative DNA primase/helicase